MLLRLRKGDKNQLSQHLNQATDNVDCGCKRPECTETLVDTAAIALFELARDVAQGPVSITSWYRCPAHNAEIGGEEASKHMEGIAFDCSPTKGPWTPSQAAALRFKMAGYGGIGIYYRGGKVAWIHADSGPERNWSKTVK